MKIVASLLAGGKGTRMGYHTPKQFLHLGGDPIFIKTLMAFLSSNLFESIYLAMNMEIITEAKKIIDRYKLSKFVNLIPGGKTRQISSWNVIKAISHSERLPDAIVIHDAARCLVDQNILNRCIDILSTHSAVTAAIPTTDTIAEISNAKIKHVPARKALWQIQTPQAFYFDIIFKAQNNAISEGIIDASDDAQLVLRTNQSVYVFEGSKNNIKITTPHDLIVAEALLQSIS